MKYIILLSLILPSFLLANIPRQKREFVPIPPINKKEQRTNKEIELPSKDPQKNSEPDASLFPTPKLDWD